MTTIDRDLERGRRIRYVRVALLRMSSQTAFADWVGGVTRGAVGNWERGLDISLDNLTTIAERARVPFDWLAFGKGAAPTTPEGRPAQPLQELMSAFDSLPDHLQKQFLRHALGLEENDRK